MEGLHLIGDLTGCKEKTMLARASAGEKFAIEAVAQAGLACVGKSFHQFEPGGWTGLVLLAESHLAIHTWPELGKVTLDVYVCNHEKDNREAATRLFEACVAGFKAAHCAQHEVMRGEHFLVEELTAKTGMWVKAPELLIRKKSKFQEGSIYQTADFGRLLRINGQNMTSEKDEFFYHEALVHPALLALDNPEEAKVLVIGGGDGGALEEMLKHPVKEAHMCEIDQMIVEICEEWLPSINKGAFRNPRAKVFFKDGAEFIRRAKGKYAVALLDLQDPMVLTSALYQEDFLREASGAMTENGRLVMHIGSAMHNQERWGESLRLLRKVFPSVEAYAQSIPIYGGLWGFALCSKKGPGKLSGEEAQKRIKERAIGGLQLLNAGSYEALFALPEFARVLGD